MSYDPKYDNFKLGTFDVELVTDPAKLQFREVKLPKERGGDDTKHAITSLQKLFTSTFSEQIGPDFDLVDTFSRSGAPCLLEVCPENGILLYALSKCLFAVQGDKAHSLLTGDVDTAKLDAKDFTLFHKAFPSDIAYVKVAGSTLAIAAGPMVYFFNLKEFISGGGQIDPMAEAQLLLDESDFIRQISLKHDSALITTSLESLFEFDFASKFLHKVCTEQVRSAIYNQAQDFIIALINLERDDQSHFAFFTANATVTQPLSAQMTLDF
jgi:hypothetical protein